MSKKRRGNNYGLNPIINGPEIDTCEKDDIIDFVSGGFLPPLKRDFDKVMEEARYNLHEESSSIELNGEAPKKFEKTMKRVYNHRVKQRNIGLAIGAGVLALFGVTNYKNKKIIKKLNSDNQTLSAKNKELEEDNDIFGAFHRVTIKQF